MPPLAYPRMAPTLLSFLRMTTARRIAGLVSLYSLAFSLIGCGGPSTQPVSVDPTEASDSTKADGSSSAIPDVVCAGSPNAGPKASWRHSFKSWVTTTFHGSARHRGIDLVASAEAEAQVLSGELGYGLTDKALEDERVDLFACKAGAWQPIGSTLSDDEGHFTLTLSGADRLAIGRRDMYLSVAGNRSGARFLALVAPADSLLAISDIDGTLTDAENSFPEYLVNGERVYAHQGAAAMWQKLAAQGYVAVFLTARGRIFTQETRTWLSDEGFPRAPLRLAATPLTLPGSATVDYKAGIIAQLAAAGLIPTIGIGNRSSDIEAYAHEGIDASNLFIKLPEFEKECADAFARGEAVGFESYVELAETLVR